MEPFFLFFFEEVPCFKELEGLLLLVFHQNAWVWLWCGLCVFKREQALGRVDDVVGHLLVAAEIVA